MKQHLQYVLGSVAAIIGLFFFFATSQPALDVISHINDPSYEYPAMLTAASRAFAIIACIIAGIANHVLPTDKSKETDSAE